MPSVIHYRDLYSAPSEAILTPAQLMTFGVRIELMDHCEQMWQHVHASE